MALNRLQHTTKVVLSADKLTLTVTHVRDDGETVTVKEKFKNDEVAEIFFADAVWEMVKGTDKKPGTPDCSIVCYLE